MTASHDPNGIPPNALRMWTDGVRIYCAIPGSPGNDPYIVAHLYSEDGLTKALHLLGVHRVEYSYTGEIPKCYQKRKEPGTEIQRAQAEVTLRKLGVLK